MVERGSGAPLARVLAQAARVWPLFALGRSLDRALEEIDDDPLRPAVQAITYDAVRSRALSERVIGELATRPPALPTAALLAVALPQLLKDRRAAYTVVDQAVTAAHS